MASHLPAGVKHTPTAPRCADHSQCYVMYQNIHSVAELNPLLYSFCTFIFRAAAHFHAFCSGNSFHHCHGHRRRRPYSPRLHLFYFMAAVMWSTAASCWTHRRDDVDVLGPSPPHQPVCLGCMFCKKKVAGKLMIETDNIRKK